MLVDRFLPVIIINTVAFFFIIILFFINIILHILFILYFIIYIITCYYLLSIFIIVSEPLERKGIKFPRWRVAVCTNDHSGYISRRRSRDA